MLGSVGALFLMFNTTSEGSGPAMMRGGCMVSHLCPDPSVELLPSLRVPVCFLQAVVWWCADHGALQRMAHPWCGLHTVPPYWNFCAVMKMHFKSPLQVLVC